MLVIYFPWYNEIALFTRDQKARSDMRDTRDEEKLRASWGMTSDFHNFRILGDRVLESYLDEGWEVVGEL